MRTKDLHELPKARDRLSYLYIEHCRIDQEAKAIAIHDATGVTPVPCADLAVLMLGPGTRIRGREGVRVRDAYARMALQTGIEWRGRSYDRANWRSADPANRALSSASSCLYGICHAAIVAAGYSPALGFIHTGKLLSFVYDIAHLYEVGMTIPVAFETAASTSKNLEREVRMGCRDAFAREEILQRIVREIEHVLEVRTADDDDPNLDFDADPALPGGLWDPDSGETAGGVSYGEQEQT